MPQFRLTQKFATDCKIKQLIEPVITAHPLDDWFIDRLIIDRKKVAMITHGKSAFTFFIPYADGAKGMIDYFKEQLKDLFLRNSLPTLALEVDKLFAGELVYAKTVDRKILGHMNDFRRCSKPYPGDPYPIDWQDKVERINNMPINADSRNSSFPIENFNELLCINLPKRKSRYSWLTK
jgi:hypothetical protein